MKFAVIFGVLHMVFGILIKAINSIHFHDWLTLFFEFLPQLLFLLSLFGFMIVTIVIKWATDWTNVKEAPSLINNMINMVLNFGEIHNMEPIWDNRTHQEHVQMRFI